MARRSYARIVVAVVPELKRGSDDIFNGGAQIAAGVAVSLAP